MRESSNRQNRITQPPPPLAAADCGSPPARSCNLQITFVVSRFGGRRWCPAVSGWKRRLQPLSFALKIGKRRNRPGWDQGCSSCGINNGFSLFFCFFFPGGLCCFHSHRRESLETLRNGARCYFFCPVSIYVCGYFGKRPFFHNKPALNELVNMTCPLEILLVHSVFCKCSSSRHAGQHAPTLHRQL